MEPDKEEHNKEEQPVKTSFMGRLLSLLAVIMIILILLGILASLVVRDTDFQNWAVNKVTSSLSERLETKVDLERVDLDFFNKLSFSKFYVEDYNKDTLLFVEELDVDLDVNIKSLLFGRMSIDEISLTNGDIKIRRDSGQFANNIQLLLDKLKSADAQQTTSKKPKGKAFDLNLDRINLEDICFVQDDKLRGQDIDACFDNAQINFDDFILDDNLFNIDDITVEGVNVDIFEYIRNEELFNKWYYLPSENSGRQTLDSLYKPMVITVKDLYVKDGKLDLKNIRKSLFRTMSNTVLDYKNLNLDDINVHVKNLNYSERQGSGQIASLNVTEKSGFKIEDLFVDDLLVNERTIVAKDYKLKTPHSTFGSNLTLKYKEFDDFWEFEDKIYINTVFSNTDIGVKDIIYLVGTLESNEFLQLNIDETLSINGKINGRVNSLKGSNLDIKLSDKLSFNGNFRSRNLSVKNEEYVDLSIGQLNVSMISLRQLIPTFNLPDNFNKLGNLNFNGNFTGFFNDFTAYGDLKTDLGGVTSDVSLELTEGIDKAKYEGKLSLIDFDLATWTGDSKFGDVTISAIVKEGIGLRRDVASAKLSATVEDFSYKGYDYENIELIGRLDKNEFDGDLNIQDENIDLDFGGKISFAEEKPLFKFKSNVRNIDFQKLNLSSKNLVLSGNADINVIGDKLSNITGEIYLSDFNISLNNDLNYDLDTIALRSLVNENGNKNFHLESELLNIDLDGQFDLDKISFAFKDYMVAKFPEYAERLSISPSGKTYDDMRFDMDLEVFDSENLTYFLDTRIDTIRDMAAYAHFDTYTDSLYLLADLPSFTFDNNTLENINILIEANEEDTELVLGILGTRLKGGQILHPINLLASAKGDEIDFNFNIIDYTNAHYDILVNGILKVEENKVFELTFLPSNLTLMNQEWDVTPNNYIRVGSDFVEIEDFAFTNGYQKIHFHSYGQKGLEVNFEHFDLEEINKYTNYDKLFFDGDFSLDITAEDIFTQTNIGLNLNMDTLKIFEDDWGVLNLQAQLPSLEDNAKAYLSLTKGDQQILAEGYYVVPNKNAKRSGGIKDNYFNFDISSNAVPLSLLEYFIPTGLSNTVGLVDADVVLKGYPNDIDSDGTLRVYDGAFNVDYLGTRYFIEDGIVTITKDFIDGTGGIVKDRFGNEATLDGGIYWKNLKDMVLALTINAPEFLALDTKKGDNDLFYGIGIGQGSVEFKGPFTQTDIDINAVTLDGTDISIPILSTTSETSEISFINFVERKEEEEAEKEEETQALVGVNISINMEITNDSDIRIIFDEEAGDIVETTGRGNIEIKNFRTGEFSMYGNYEIEEGEYLFTYSYRDLVKFNKPFVVQRGGRIVWNGDPYAAKINLVAKYDNLRTSIYNLIAEFLVPPTSDALILEARNTTSVDLEMILTGDLFAPDIAFQLDFPELDGELQGYVDSKMLYLSRDANELNRQVFGLLVVGGFLPSEQSAIGSEVVNFGVNTVSQFLSSQLSLYVSELLAEILDDNGVLNRTEFDVNYSVYNNQSINQTINATRASELSFQVKNYLFQERLAIKIGTDIGIGDQTAVTGNNVSAINTFDVIVEWVITKDRRFKLQVYNQNENTIFGPQRTSGFGVSYRYEFDTFEEFVKGFRKHTREAIESKI